MGPARHYDFVADRDRAEITVTRDFAAHPALVWHCWTDPALLDRWFAPKPFRARTKAMDFRPGGHWLYAMVSPEGQEFWARFDYGAIRPGTGFSGTDAFCDEAGRVAPDMPRSAWDVSFAGTDLAEGRGCRVRILMRYPSREDLDRIIAMGMREGLTASLEGLDELLGAVAADRAGAAPAITISAVIGAPVERVWACWTEPRHITRWNFAADDWCCPRAANDLRPGGRYVARMEAKDGSSGFDFEMVHDEVRPGQVLASTMTDGRRVRTTFAPEGQGTRVTTVFDAERLHPVAMQHDGWMAILMNFKAYAET